MPSDPLTRRAATVLAALGIATNAAPELHRHVKTFIACNGYDSVLRATRYTASQMTKEFVHDPWAYTIHVFNGHLARLSYLYTLTHWIESALRSQIDLRLTVALGDVWYRFPARYLPVRAAETFFGDAALRAIRWERDHNAVTGKRVAEYASAGEFIEELTVGWLIQIVVHGYHGNLRGMLATPMGNLATLPEARALLERARDARNVVAHNRYLTNEEFADAQSKLPRLLTLLQFDVRKALERSEAARSPLIAATLQQLTSEGTNY